MAVKVYEEPFLQEKRNAFMIIFWLKIICANNTSIGWKDDWRTDSPGAREHAFVQIVTDIANHSDLSGEFLSDNH